MPPINNK